MRLANFLGAVAALSFPHMAVHAQAAPAQPPVARWSVDGSGARCTLARPVGGTEPVTLVIRSVPTTGKYELMLVRKDRWDVPSSKDQNIQVTFQPGGAIHQRPVKITRLDSEIGNALGAVFLSRAFFDDFGRSHSMNLAIGSRDLGSFAYPGADKVAEAFALCLDAKLIEWGADPAGLEPGARRATPLGNPTTWLLQGSPRMRAGQTSPEARNGVAKLNLDAEGKVEACDLIESTQDSLAASACSALTAAARYEPARGKDGQPVRSVMLVTWDLVTVREVRVGSRPRD